MNERITNYAAYWSYYIDQHRNPANRTLHYLGSITGAILLAAAMALQIWWMIPVALASAFGLGMLGHALFETPPAENHHYPLWALASDFRMLDLFLGGRIRRDFIDAGVHERASCPMSSLEPSAGEPTCQAKERVSTSWDCLDRAAHAPLPKFAPACASPASFHSLPQCVRAILPAPTGSWAVSARGGMFESAQSLKVLIIK